IPIPAVPTRSRWGLSLQQSFQGDNAVYKASAGIVLPTSIIGSLPRPAWHTAQLGRRSFLEAMVNARWREQYEDAVSTHLRAQEVAGLDICTDGDAHYDEEIGGWSWQSYPLTHMAGFSQEVALTPPAVANAAPPRGMILQDQLEARVLPRITGPLGPGDLQYSAMWKVAQRLTRKPVKFGTIMPELLAAAVRPCAKPARGAPPDTSIAGPRRCRILRDQAPPPLRGEALRTRESRGMDSNDGIASLPWYRSLNREQWRVLVASNLGWLFDGFEIYALFLTVGFALHQLLDPSQYKAIPQYAGYILAGTVAGWATGGGIGGEHAA